MLLFRLFVLFHLSFAADGQHAVLDLNVNVVSLDLRQFGLDQVLFLRLADIGSRAPVQVGA